jgi:hypothetical protein
MRLLAYKPPHPGGGWYHRCYLPLSNMGASFTTSITEEVVRNHDLLYLHWSAGSKYPTFLYSLLKKRYGFKIILDIDDSWQVGNHIEKRLLEQSIAFSKDAALLADQVICSTEGIAAQVKKYNPNTHIIPNLVPYGQGQFKVKDERWEDFEKRKIRIGFIGSHSHLNDWMSLRNVLKRIAGDKEVQDKCQFVLGGYSEDNPVTKKLWTDLANLFPNCLLLWGRPFEDYMQIYHKCDILLNPLLDTSLNRCKSNLKVRECAASLTIPIIDKIGFEKEPVNQYVPRVHRSEDWFLIIKRLIANKQSLFNHKQDLSYMIRKDKPYESILKARQEVFDLPVEEKPTQIRSIIYHPEQVTEYPTYLNTVKTIEERSYLFEHQIYPKLVEEVQEGYFGVLSHKFPFKTRLFRKAVEYLLKDETADVVNFCAPLPEPYLKFSEEHHPGFLELFTKVCEKLNLKVKEPRHHIYGSFFVAKAPVYKRFVKECVLPCIELLEGEFREEAWKDSQYASGLPLDKLQEFTGLPYYPLLTFIPERLPSLWFEQRGYSIKTKHFIT